VENELFHFEIEIKLKHDTNLKLWFRMNKTFDFYHLASIDFQIFFCVLLHLLEPPNSFLFEMLEVKVFVEDFQVKVKRENMMEKKLSSTQTQQKTPLLALYC
jgi:hypothetical protein